MGSIGTLLGTAGGAGGTGFAAPQRTNLQQPINQQQVQGGQTGVDNSLQSSNSLLSALQAQNGTQNQSAVWGEGNSLATILGNANGTNDQTTGIKGLQNVLGQQQITSNQLQGIANGTGPNPAQAALNQATGQNVANQAALMAGQRGAGANVGLMARQSAQQGANTQQQAAGQSATMQAQQQLNAINAIGAQQQAMAGTNQGIIGAGAGLNAQQQNQLGMNAGITQNQVGNLAGVTGQNVQGNIANAGQLINMTGGLNTNAVNSQGNVNTANASLANTGMQGQQAFIGGTMNGIGSAMGSMGGGGGGARGGMVRKPKKMAEGGEPSDAPYQAPQGQGPVLEEPEAPSQEPGPITQPANGPQSSFGQFLAGQTSTPEFLNQSISQTPMASTEDTSSRNSTMEAPAMGYGSQELYKGAYNSSKEATEAAMAAAKGGMAHDYRSGGPVKAKNTKEKAVKPGNSYANDKIKALLSEGEIVIPRDVLQSKDPVRSAGEFVAKTLAKRKVKG